MLDFTTKENQNIVSMIWNDAFYLKKDDSDNETIRSVREYYCWLYGNIKKKGGILCQV